MDWGPKKGQFPLVQNRLAWSYNSIVYAMQGAQIAGLEVSQIRRNHYDDDEEDGKMSPAHDMNLITRKGRAKCYEVKACACV